MGEWFSKARNDLPWYFVSVAVITGIAFVFSGWIDPLVRGLEHVTGFWEFTQK